MKKVVFLIGMMVGFASTVFGQYDVVTVSSEDDFTEMETWYQVKGESNEYYFFAEPDERIDDYIKHFVSYYDGDINNPTLVDKIDGDKYVSFVTDYSDATITVVIGYHKDMISIYMIKE